VSPPPQASSSTASGSQSSRTAVTRRARQRGRAKQRFVSLTASKNQIATACPLRLRGGCLDGGAAHNRQCRQAAQQALPTYSEEIHSRLASAGEKHEVPVAGRAGAGRGQVDGATAADQDNWRRPNALVKQVLNGVAVQVAANAITRGSTRSRKGDIWLAVKDPY
jgi:hypothetical protein